MGVKKTKLNFRVIVEPRGLGDLGGAHVPVSWLYKTPEAEEKAWRSVCQEIVDGIKRHVNDVGSVSIDFDIEETCEHCGLPWKLDNKGMNGCCDQEIEEWIAKNPGSICEECTAWLVDDEPHLKTCSKANTDQKQTE